MSSDIWLEMGEPGTNCWLGSAPLSRCLIEFNANLRLVDSIVMMIWEGLWKGFQRPQEFNFRGRKIVIPASFQFIPTSNADKNKRPSAAVYLHIWIWLQFADWSVVHNGSVQSTENETSFWNCGGRWCSAWSTQRRARWNLTGVDKDRGSARSENIGRSERRSNFVDLVATCELWNSFDSNQVIMEKRRFRPRRNRFRF